MGNQKSSDDKVLGYIEDVESGRRATGRLERLAVRRYLHDLKHGARRGWRLDKPLARHACEFFDCLVHSKGEWARQPFVLSGWEAFVIWNLFGWVGPDNLRRHHYSYIETARKNGKSTFAAGVGIYLFAGDAEPGSEVYTAATKRDQARIVHSEAIRMRDASPYLSKYIEKFKDNLSIPLSASKYEPLGADVDGMDGLNIHGAIVDEVHAHKSRKCWDVIDTGTGARRQPLMFAITTAGSNKETICWELRSIGVNALEGFETGAYVDDRFFAFIATLDDGDDWKDEAVWGKANPNLGVSVKVDKLRDECRRAEQIPAKQNAFRRLRLNQWTEQENRWISMEAWDECEVGLDPEKLKGRVAFGGLDLASKNDIAAYVLAFEDEDGGVTLKAQFWVPRESLKRRQRDRIPYELWIEQGWIEVTNGDICDYDLIEKRVSQSGIDYEVREIAYDPWNATQLVTHLMDEGAPMIEVSQSYKSLSPATKEWERLVLGRKLRHGGNPTLRWMMSNCAIEMDGNENQKPSRKHSNEKIDGVYAGIMALGRLMTQSVYEIHGVRDFEITDDDLDAYGRGDFDE